MQQCRSPVFYLLERLCWVINAVQKIRPPFRKEVPFRYRDHVLVWVEKTRFNITEPASDIFPDQTSGAINELLNLFDELINNTDARRMLISELVEIDKKLPVELKSGSDKIQFDDTDWIGDLLKQAKPMLIKRLLKKGIA